jgi:tetratricopeptide (TPR) repeat protein
MGLRLALLVALLSAGPARADDLAASKAAFVEGKRLYNLGEFRQALAKFRQAYMKYDAPALLYNIAQCHLQLGEKREALNFYRRYLQNTANAPDRAEVQRQVAQLERELGGKPVVIKPSVPAEPPPAAPPVVAPAPSVAVAAPPPSDSRPLVKKPWFWAALGGAAVVVGVSLGVGLGVGLSRTEAPAFSGTPTHGTFQF